MSRRISTKQNKINKKQHIAKTKQYHIVVLAPTCLSAFPLTPPSPSKIPGARTTLKNPPGFTLQTTQQPNSSSTVQQRQYSAMDEDKRTPVVPRRRARVSMSSAMPPVHTPVSDSGFVSAVVGGSGRKERRGRSSLSMATAPRLRSAGAAGLGGLELGSAQRRRRLDDGSPWLGARGEVPSTVSEGKIGGPEGWEGIFFSGERDY